MDLPLLSSLEKSYLLDGHKVPVDIISFESLNNFSICKFLPQLNHVIVMTVIMTVRLMLVYSSM